MLVRSAYGRGIATVLFLIATLAADAVRAAIPEYRFHTLPETSYYGGIQGIAKDSVGRIWFSGYDALYMYNGNAFVRMNDRVTSLAPESYWSYGLPVTDRDRRLYAATNHGLLRFDYATQRFTCVLRGNITSLATDAEGRVWVVRDGRVESFDGSRSPEVRAYPLPDDAGSGPQVPTLICSQHHVLAALAGRLLRIDPASGRYEPFAAVGDGNTVIRDVLEYGGSVYVLTHKDGLYECDRQGRVLQYFRLPHEYEKSAEAKVLYLDPEGIVWVATQSGLLLLDPETDRTRLLRADFRHPYSLPNNSVWSVYPDPDGGVWIGTYGGKLAYTTFTDSDVDYCFKAMPGGLGHPIVSCFEEDAQGDLWVGTEGGGITCWHRGEDRFEYYTQEQRSGLASNMVKMLWHDRRGRLLVSSFNGGMQRFDRATGRFVDLHADHPVSGQPLSVYDFAEEGDAGFWLTDPDTELIFMDRRTGRTEPVRLSDGRGGSVSLKVETLFHDALGRLWLVTRTGAYVVDPAARRIVDHYLVAEAPYAANNLCSYCIASDGTVWFGTRGGGVNRLTPDGRYERFGTSEGENLAGKTVFGILEDDMSHDIWFSTDDGLYYYDRAENAVRKSRIDVPNRCGAYYVRSCYKTAAGEMLFGGTDGFILFTPGRIRYNPQKPKVYFTDLLIDNRPAVPGAKGSPLRRSIATMACTAEPDDDRTIRLTHRQSNLEIRFSSDSYLNAEKNQYVYRMVGLTDRWSLLPQGQRAVQFFNLPAGSYRFEIRAANNDGVWSDALSTLAFEVSPSPWLSSWAYACYAALLLGIVYFVWRYFTNKKMFEERLEVERIKEQNMKELTRARINFFTNISHDLKTPLTLVVDPLKQLKEHLPEESEGRTYVRLIEKNVVRIQRMISQLLQFREIESQKITLNRQSGDLVRFVGSIFSLFEFYAGKKGIETDFGSQYESFYTSFDHDVIEKICTNLFSNAIKYTSDNGYVGVRIARATEQEIAGIAAPDAQAVYLAVTVTNTGAEIPEEQREAIFESFNRLSARRPDFETSTGLGLAIVRELVANLGGCITLHSGNSRVAFTVVLPFVLHDEQSDHTGESYDYTLSEIDNLLSESDESQTDRRERKACDIVVIEDDANLRGYLELRLSKRYNVYTAADGEEGIAKAEKICPQIVITDLMMPRVDGFEVCRRLRSNIKTCHIPVVMLSGMGKESENKIKALECGANVFIDKPFDMDFLLKQVASLIRTRNEFKELYSKKYIAEPSKLTISSMDDELLHKAMDCIERNIDNNDYDVDAFVSDMAVGRTLLYQKINDLTGMSIKEFIMDIRLKRAAQLLRESDLTIAEIALLTGFANPKYFSICFKRHFELTPSEFKKK